MERKPLESTAVRGAGYDDESEELEVEFRSGRIYVFSNIPRSVYDWLLRTPSKGAYVSRIVNQYDYREVTPASPEPDLEAALKASLDRSD